MILFLLQRIAAALAGFSCVSALILLMLYCFSLPEIKKTLSSKLVCALILGGLTTLQTLHFLYFIDGRPLLYQRGYVSLLMLIPPSFYLFSRIVVFRDQSPNLQNLLLNFLHLLPIAVSFTLPAQVIPSIAFTLGTCYTTWLALRLIKLQQERRKFKVELFFFVLFAAMALFALLLGLFLPLINLQWFYLFYANCISVAMICVVSALLMFPELLGDVVAITERAYHQSRLDNVDTQASLKQLEKLFSEQELFKDESITLGATAELLGLSAHQLSELINRHHEMNFPRYVKSFRIQAAKRQLCEQPKVSMLAISLDNGFKSQSAFYSAFKEATGMSPGNYRKQAR